jgi:hypothetical protein
MVGSCFDHQSRFRAGETRHFEFKLCVPEGSRLRRKLERFSRSIDARRNSGAFDGFIGCIPDGDLQQCAFAGEPGFYIEEFEMENFGRGISV